MSLTAQYDADQNTGKIFKEAKHISLRIDGTFIGLPTGALARPTSIENGFLTSTYIVPRNVALELSQAHAIGFAWLPSETSIFYGFDLPVADSQDAVSSFVKHCSER